MLTQMMAWHIRGMNWLKLAARCMIVEGRIVENSNFP